VETAAAVEIEVRWSEKAGTKRVVTDQEAELAVGPQSWSLPYQVCLSELLYGEALYRQRRAMWGLPLPAGPVAAPAAGGAGIGVAGAGDGGVGDGGRAPRTRDAASGG
jgi:hypothetical protein